MRSLALVVHRSFRKFEACADWLTGAAGPVFVLLCLFLVGVGVWTFFSTMFPYLAPFPPTLAKLVKTRSPIHIILGLLPALAQHPWLALRWVLALSGCAFIVYSIGYHYMMAVREPPGSVLDGLSDELGERRLGPGSEHWWQRHRRRAARESVVALRRRQHKSLQNEPPLPLAPPRATPAATTIAARVVSTVVDDDEADEAAESDDLFTIAKMCHKCPRVALWRALASLPPELREVERRLRSVKKVEQQQSHQHQRKSANGNGHHSPVDGWGQDQDTVQSARGETEDDIRAWLGDEADNLVPPPKPERTHHCSVCETCVLKFDHHCPWLNQCVGLGNERYFLLFMAWLSLGCFVVVCSGFPVVRQSISFGRWEYRYTPRVFVLLTYALCAIMGFALAVMSTWQALIIAWGETSVENSDNTHYREVCRRKNVAFTNVYDVGFLHNLELYFNVGAQSRHGYLSILAPWRIEPYSDGWHWAKTMGMGLAGRHEGISPDDELTDDEEQAQEDR